MATQNFKKREKSWKDDTTKVYNNLLVTNPQNKELHNLSTKKF